MTAENDLARLIKSQRAAINVASLTTGGWRTQGTRLTLGELALILDEIERLNFIQREFSNLDDVVEIRKLRELLTRACYGFVDHLCHNGKMSGGLSCLACEINSALHLDVSVTTTEKP